MTTTPTFQKVPMFKSLLILLFLLPQPLFAEPWEQHQDDIQELERDIYKHQQELDVLVEKKKNTRERARIEQTLQRIVEIHAELISLRKGMDSLREHLKEFHPEKAHILDNYDSRVLAAQRSKKNYQSSPLSQELDNLLIKVQLKFSSFIRTEEQSDEMIQVDTILSQKRKKKKEREADVYLRRRSKIKMVK